MTTALEFPLGFSPVENLHRSADTLVVAGSWWGEPAVAKRRINASVQQDAQFERELAAYRFFATMQVPLSVPRLLAADVGSSTVVLSRLAGVPIGAERHPSELAQRDWLARIFTEVRRLGHWRFDEQDPALAGWRVDYDIRLDRARRNGLINDSELVALRGLLDAARKSGWVVAHGDLESSNILYSNTGFSYLDWESAGIYLPGFDLALMWVLLGKIPGPRRVIEELVAEESGDARPAFWLNVVLLLARELRMYSSLRPAPARDEILAALRADWVTLRERGWIGA